MRFTALDLTHSGCCGDSILAAAQILTPGFSGRISVGMESGVAVLGPPGWLESSHTEKGENYNARNVWPSLFRFVVK